MQKVEALRICRQSAHEGGMVNPMYRVFYPSPTLTQSPLEISLLLIAEPTESIKEVKNSNDLPASSTLPQPTAPPSALLRNGTR
jgi:hypothetical protein